jgi:hypothetical protein
MQESPWSDRAAAVRHLRGFALASWADSGCERRGNSDGRRLFEWPPRHRHGPVRFRASGPGDRSACGAPHATVTLAWFGYAIALYLRRDLFSGTTVIGTPTLCASVLGAALLAVGGWLGERLVYIFGAGVSNTR